MNSDNRAAWPLQYYEELLLAIDRAFVNPRLRPCTETFSTDCGSYIDCCALGAVYLNETGMQASRTQTEKVLNWIMTTFGTNLNFCLGFIAGFDSDAYRGTNEDYQVGHMVGEHVSRKYIRKVGVR
jgi:hypothetical protein